MVIVLKPINWGSENPPSKWPNFPLRLTPVGVILRIRYTGRAFSKSMGQLENPTDFEGRIEDRIIHEAGDLVGQEVIGSMGYL